MAIKARIITGYRLLNKGEFIRTGDFLDKVGPSPMNFRQRETQPKCVAALPNGFYNYYRPNHLDTDAPEQAAPNQRFKTDKPYPFGY